VNVLIHERTPLLPMTPAEELALHAFDRGPGHALGDEFRAEIVPGGRA